MYIKKLKLFHQKGPPLPYGHPKIISIKPTHKGFSYFNIDLCQGSFFTPSQAEIRVGKGGDEEDHLPPSNINQILVDSYTFFKFPFEGNIEMFISWLKKPNFTIKGNKYHISWKDK